MKQLFTSILTDCLDDLVIMLQHLCEFPNTFVGILTEQGGHMARESTNLMMAMTQAEKN